MFYDIKMVSKYKDCENESWNIIKLFLFVCFHEIIPLLCITGVFDPEGCVIMLRTAKCFRIFDVAVLFSRVSW